MFTAGKLNVTKNICKQPLFVMSSIRQLNDDKVIHLFCLSNEIILYVLVLLLWGQWTVTEGLDDALEMLLLCITCRIF